MGRPRRVVLAMFPIVVKSLSGFATSCFPGGGGGFLGFPTWYKYLDSEPVAGKCSVKLTLPGDISRILLALAEILLRVGGLVAVGFIVYGGFQFILSQGQTGPGNVPKTTIARHTVVNALIGLVVASLATFIVTLVGRTLSK